MKNFDPSDKSGDLRRQRVYALWKQKMNVTDIVSRLGRGVGDDGEQTEGEFPDITVSDVIEDIRASRTNIKEFVKENPFYLDAKLQLIIEKVEALDVIAEMMWAEYRAAPDEHRHVRTNLLTAIQRNEMEQAKLLQLLGNASEVVTKLEQATKAQQELIQAIRDVTSTCPKCANMLALKLKNMSMKQKEEVPKVPKDATIQ